MVLSIIVDFKKWHLSSFTYGSLTLHGNIVGAYAFEARPKLSELAKLNANEIKVIPPIELVCNLYLLIREDLSLGVR